MTWKAIVVRRRRLGRTSVRELCRLSVCDMVEHRSDLPRPAGECDIAIRWGCTANVNERRVLNTADAIHQVNDKAAFRKITADAGLSPRTWTDWGVFVDQYMQMEGYPLSALHFESLLGPVVVRPTRHAQGRNLFVCDIPEHVYDLVMEHPALEQGFYISELFPKTHEYRVCVVQDRVAWVASKTPGNPDDVAWNVARGGRFDNVRWDAWNLEVIRAAIRAFQLTHLDFGGVDVMWDENTQRASVLEINSAPSLTSPYRQGALAKCFDHILINENKERLAVDLDGRGWRDYIHPGIWPRKRDMEVNDE